MRKKRVPAFKKISTQGLFVHGAWGRSVDEFIEIARMIYGDHYGYERVVYRGCGTPVEITCPVHGPFSITPSAFFSRGNGCPLCGRERGLAKRAISFEEFLRRARKAHGEKYRYDEASYTGVGAKVTITCPKHGPFRQKGGDHLAGSGCPVCGRENTTAKERMPFEEFLRRARKAHGEKYRYDEASYTCVTAKVTVICPKHGPFTQKAVDHLMGHGCPACGWESTSVKKTMSFEEFTRLARKVHGEKYRYDEASYTYSAAKVTIICPKHGEFRQNGSSHLGGIGCPACGWERTSAKGRMSFEEFTRLARKAHGEKYRYDEASYTRASAKLTVICPVHGPFRQNGSAHLGGSGCPACGRKRTGAKNILPFEEFTRRARKVHGEKYRYDEASYRGVGAKLTVICPVHGEFTQTGEEHLAGRGCRACACACRRESATVKTTMPFEEFLRRARKAHGEKYRYDEASYRGSEAKVTIICPVHGPFTQMRKEHLAGRGCRACSQKFIASKRILPFEEFLRRARKVHGEKYRYDEASYTHSEAKLTIICPVHGPFSQRGAAHFHGQGCPACGRERSIAARGSP